MKTRRFRIAAMALIGVLLACSAADSSPGQVGSRFLSAVANQRERKAYSYLSEDTRAAVDELCDDGSIIACFESTGIYDSGKPEDILFVHGDADGYWGYYMFFDQKSYDVVVEIDEENGEWVVVGWWGLEQTDGPFSGDMIEGIDRPNVFPPTD